MSDGNSRMTSATTRAPGWYWAAAGGALLFELAGCLAYLAEVRMTDADIAALPLDQAALLAARPDWYYAAFGIAVWVGLVGAIGLLLRRRWAAPALLVSLVAVVVQVSSVLIVPEMRAVPSDALIISAVVIMVAYAFWQMARLSARRGWLR
ncbi:hypothetical protein [Sphingomonas xanthus]|uniref:Sugar transporter n=1 Tax=Sphingomonas xanthus TaxID=2594473 RepID=A0A516IQJ1_9SPHN|nr:hypothetical protein [Sphingomonas xanthus]QDP19178.1 hypothetical protein FMM02_03890 [Sphingomonas xanthus]